MNSQHKKIIIISLGAITATASGKREAEDISDFRIRKDVLDRIASMKGVVRVIITHDNDEKEYMAQLKAIEFFVFVYCKVAVSTISRGEDIIETLPHNLRRKELMLSVGDRLTAEEMEIDYTDTL